MDKQSQRKFLLYKLNRLSTKQLQAKYATVQRFISAQRQQYAVSLPATNLVGAY